MTHLPTSRLSIAQLSGLVLAGVFFFTFAAGLRAADAPAPGKVEGCLSAHGDLATGAATVTLSGGTLHRAGQAGQVFVPLQVMSKTLRDFGTGQPAGQFFLFENIFHSLDTEWAGFTFTITALPETSAVVVLSALLVVMFFWPTRRRVIKDLKSIVGLRPPGRVRIEAYRRRANDDGQPRDEVWADVPVVRQKVPAVPVARERERCQPDEVPAGEPLLPA